MEFQVGDRVRRADGVKGVVTNTCDKEGAWPYRTHWEDEPCPKWSCGQPVGLVSRTTTEPPATPEEPAWLAAARKELPAGWHIRAFDKCGDSFDLCPPIEFHNSWSIGWLRLDWTVRRAITRLCEERGWPDPYAVTPVHQDDTAAPEPALFPKEYVDAATYEHEGAIVTNPIGLPIAPGAFKGASADMTIVDESDLFVARGPVGGPLVQEMVRVALPFDAWLREHEAARERAEVPRFDVGDVVEGSLFEDGEASARGRYFGCSTGPNAMEIVYIRTAAGNSYRLAARRSTLIRRAGDR